MPAKRTASSAPAPSAPERARLTVAIQRRRQRYKVMEARLRQQETRIEELGEALRHGDRHKSEFLSTMSHELRTPLNVVLGFASLIADEAFGPLNKEQQEACDKVLQSAERLTTLVNDLLDAAKLDRGTLTFDRESVDVCKLAEIVIEDIAPLAAEKELGLDLDIHTTVSDIEADAYRLRQVLAHLLDNAVKFTPKGGRIGVRVSEFESLVAIEVWDTGIGIPEASLYRLFERFYQVDGSSTREYGGTGIGLAIVKEFIERLGGEVTVDSELGKGSTFKLVLPAKR